MTTLKDRVASATTALRRKLEIEDRAPSGIEAQPVSVVRWVRPEQIRPASWNPNYVPPPELRLLKISILSDGWTQPIVVSELPDDEIEGDIIYEVTDGEHRHIVGRDPEVAALTGGYVPVVILRPVNREHRMMSTVRHNRARGQHAVIGMADIVNELASRSVPAAEIGVLLQMEEEEVQRFLDRGDMLKRGVGDADDFNQGWVPR
jgi:ParB-like chromosome segregation protein Spo0J